MTGYDELAAFDNDFNPSVGGQRPGIETLPDGDYDFEVTSAELTRTEKSNELILRVGLRVGGKVVEHAYFFRTQTGVDILGGDLCTLGFDSDQWKPPHRPFSRELVAAVPRMVGLRFRGRKVTKPDKKEPTKSHANLYVNQLLGAAGSAPGEYTPLNQSDPIPF